MKNIFLLFKTSFMVYFRPRWWTFHSQLLGVASLRDDPGELHLPPGVDLEPVLPLLGLGAPGAAVQVVVVAGALRANVSFSHAQLASQPTNRRAAGL